MQELSPRQMKVLERLLEAGFRPIAIAPHESALCVRKGECAAVLAPIPGGGLRLLAPPSFLVNGNLSVRLKRGKGEVFAWKRAEVPATAERVAKLEEFRSELSMILESTPVQ